MKIRDMSIKEIRAWLDSVDYNPSEVEYVELTQETRNGVKPLIERIERKRELMKKQWRKWQEMSVTERMLREQGYKWIAGIDEVGRGPLAGPVVSAAVILPEDFYLPGLNDSKQLNKQTREKFFDIICEQAISIGVSTISVEIIDKINILQATHRSMLEAIALLEPTPEYLLIDALTLDTPIPQQGVIGGDEKSISIAAASVIAKVTRDRIMNELAEQYPQYGFDRNMGYGTKEHLEAIATYGATEHHRKTFAGVKEWL